MKLKICIFLALVWVNSTFSSNYSNEAHKTVFITGGAGFIGSSFVEYLFNNYPTYRLLILDALTYAGNLDNIPPHILQSDRVHFIHGSVTHRELVDKLMQQADLVVHFAAETHVARSIDDAAVFFETDVIGTSVMMDSLMKYKNRVERFVHISSSEVYGTAETKPMDENHPINPRSPYAAAKAGADRLVYAYQCTYDLPTVIVRPFNNYGPRQHVEKVIPSFITSVLRGDPITIHGEGRQTRDWVHVEDTCKALDKILHHKNFTHIKHDTFNIGTGKETSIIDVAKMIIAQFGFQEYPIVYFSDRPGQVVSHNASTQRAYEKLNWESEISFSAGIQSTIAWYKNHSQLSKIRESEEVVSSVAKREE